MRVKIEALWERISTSFWFVPALMLSFALLLALALLAIDQTNEPIAADAFSWVYAGSPDGARAVLSTIAGSMISVASLTFSITIVTLSLASSQFGPRLLDRFMRDRGNQIVLGTFVSIFMYCLLILRSIRSDGEIIFVPHLAVSAAMLQALISVGILIYFFHHVAMSIQAQTVIASLGHELEESIETHLTDRSSARNYEYELRSDEDIPADFKDQSEYIAASSSGYLQAIDYAGLKKMATDNDLLLKMLYRPGDFVAKGSEIIKVYPAHALSEDLQRSLINTLTLGAKRLKLQDTEFIIEQLVEIAVRALSPGVNDPFTAIACLDQLGTTLSGLAERPIPSGFYYDSSSKLRLISDSLTFEGMINSAFNQIRQHGRSDVAVTIRMLEVLAIIITRTNSRERKDALMRQADMVKRACDATFSEENDLQDIMKRYELIVRIYNDERVIAGDDEEDEEAG